jgi:mono/diheme cytochrome c family protein
MRRLPVVSIAVVFVLVVLSLPQYGCNEQAVVKTDTVAASKTLSHTELIARGRYLVTSVGSCSDCHSPKIFTAMGPVPDSSKALSGHPAGSPTLAIDKKVLTPGNWMYIGPDLTSFVGPFGISYAANLTPDSATGLGAWTEEVFVKTLRTGKHLGQEGGRPILPPMPWQGIGQSTDEDLKAIYTYLQSLPPISNKVPAPVSPPDVAKMK